MSIYANPGVFEPKETDDRLIGVFNQLPRLKLNGTPRDLEDLIYYRSANGQVFRVKWQGMGVGDDFAFIEGLGKWGYLLPPFEGFYLYSPSEYAVRPIGKTWVECAEKLVLKGIADYTVTDNSKIIADAVEAKRKALRPKPKRTSDAKWGFTAEVCQEMKENSRF